MASQSPDPKAARAKFEDFVRRVLAVPKSELDARLEQDRRKKRRHPARPPR